ncbi:MAG: polysaccharide biosynthesis tyrosine autokinase [Rikenellaceae bacterium]
MENRRKQYISIKDAWSYLVSNIWLFICSIILSVSVAIGYIIITPPIYNRTASILIKSDEQRDAVSSVLTLGGNGSFQNNNIDINNEINILLMPQLMDDVVRRLSLQESYKVKFHNVRWVDIYHSAPIEIKLDSLLYDCSINLKVAVIDDSQFKITDLYINGEKIEEYIIENYDQPIATPYGNLTVAKSYWAAEHLPTNLYTYTRTSIASASARYSGALSVGVRSQNASIIDLSLTDGSKEKAEDILNTLISVYNENWIKDKNLITISTTNFINERLKIIEKELGDVDENISRYKSENLLPDVKTVSNINLQSSNEILKTQVQLNNQLSMAQYILQYISSSTTDSQVLPVNTGLDDNSIESQISRYNELLMRKNSLLANSSLKNPVIVDIMRELESSKNTIEASINEFINTLNFQISNTHKEEIATRNRLSENPSQELYLLSTGREQMVKEQLYLFLLQKREENELNQAFTAYNTKVLSYAKGSNIPVAPKKQIILLLGLAIGVLAPVFFLLIRESFNTVVRDKSDLKGLSIPYLGAIPSIGQKQSFRRKLQESSLIVVNNDKDIVNEAFRVVRTNLDFMLGANKNKQCSCIAITSINPKSGKSLVSLNLAASLALKRSRTLVVDGDFRRGTLSEAVHSPRKGLVNYLNSTDISIDEFIIKGLEYPLLDVLPMGIIPPNPTELLLLDKFVDVIKELRTKYDYIIFDCPPVDIVSDAAIIEKQCDSTIFIIRAGLMDKEFLFDIEELYKNKTYKNISLMLNGVDYDKNRRYGYGAYGQYGGYANHYGYGNKRKK